ncbi:hypothetical protein BH10ACT1_BH10ACT1_31850 [soil metagenome]
MTGWPHRPVTRLLLACGTLLVPSLGMAAPTWAGRSGSVTAVAGSASRVSGAPGPRTYRPPVVAPVVDPFRPPPQPWLPGNRGIEYATVAGSLVRAIGPGRVTFAGPVAGALFVTVTHPDGLRSSYSFLAAVRVAEGRVVAAGEVVAVAGPRLHLGVRRGDAYLDPASLWGRTVGGGQVVLVPLDGGGP